MKTTTDAKNWHFYFTVSDFARFLGKSPVTVRGWERKGLLRIPRDNANNRKLTLNDIRMFAAWAYGHGKIDEDRWKLIEASVTLLGLIERENQR